MLNALRNSCTALAIVTLMAACATTPDPLESRLDRTSGLTVATLKQAIVLARPAPYRATAARDYAYLGPVEINRTGSREHYLWVGMASTLDRKFFSETAPAATMLYLLVDGQPMTLPLSPWGEDIETPPYAVNTPVYEHLRARVSLDQLQRIAAADSVDVHIVARPTASDRYRLWGGRWSELADFAAAVSAQP
jgi:hypothetical protein